jgi:phosphoglycerol transferase
MTEPCLSWKLLKTGVDYALALGLCFVILAITLKLWRADLHVPFSYHGDSLFTQLWIKGIVENGWYLHQERVGFPDGSDLYDFPMSDNFHFGVLKLLALFSSDTAVIFNVFYLLSFPFVLLTSLAVLRQLGIAGRLAVVLALLYTFLPFHFLRGLRGHVFLMSYFMVPPAVLVALWICLARGASSPSQGQTREVTTFTKSQWLVVFSICLGLSSTGIYYAFFACFLFGVAGLICLSRGDVRGAVIGLALVGLVSLGVVVNLLPNILYRQTHGANPEAVVRVLAAPEVFGMKFTQLVLPMSMHRIGWLAQWKTAYNAALPVGCSDFGYLGLFGVLGFVGLLGRFLFRRAKPSPPDLLDIVQVFNVCAVLLATVGGFGMVASLFAGAWLRCFERMSIVIAFLSLLGVGVVVNRWLDRFPNISRSRFLLPGILGCVLAGALWEETSSFFVPSYAALRKEYAQDACFVRAIEASLSPGAAIFQLPYVPFPENGFLHRMGDYEHFRAYLRSRTLRWSYGAIKGRAGDAWQKRTANLPAEQMASQLLAAGFEAIYVDRHGFDDNGVRLEQELTQSVGRPVLVSPDARFVLFKLSNYEAASARQGR